MHIHYKKLIPYAQNAARLIVLDRGMFVADFVLATFIPFIMQYLIWSYIYSDKGPDDLNTNLSFVQLIFYYAFAIAFGRLNNGYDLIVNFSSQIQEVSLAPHLLRPISYPIQKFAEFMGAGIIYSIPVLVVTIAFLFISPHHISLPFMILWVLLFFLTQVLCFSISWCVALASFWLTRTSFALSFLATATTFLGGELLPPAFWPEWMLPLMNYNPFRFMISAPAETMVRADFNLLLISILYCSAYVLLFVIMANFLWGKGMKYLQQSGGQI